MSNLDEKRQLFENFFNEADKNGDGNVSICELRDIMRSKYKEDPSNDYLTNTVIALDADGDGKITLGEFLGSMMKKPREEAFKQTFQELDKGNTGKLRKDQISEFCQNCGNIKNQADIEAMFNEVDVNNDGVISFEEFMKLV